MILRSQGEGCGSDERGHEAEGVTEVLEHGHGTRKAVSSWPPQNWKTVDPEAVKTTLELVCRHPGVDGCGLDTMGGTCRYGEKR